MILSLVKPDKVGTTVGLMSAAQTLAENGIVNLILLVYNATKNMMNGFCFFVLTLVLGIDLILAM